MHKYNPLELPEIIANIVCILSLKDLDKLCWINCTWYKEVKQELRKRCVREMLHYDEIRQKEEKAYEELYKNHPFNINNYDDIILAINKNYYLKRKLTATEQIIIESCMLANGMLSDKQEKEIVKYNIQTMISEKRIPWEYKKLEKEDEWDFSLSIYRQKCFAIIPDYPL